jgi:hypothetical protein
MQQLFAAPISKGYAQNKTQKVTDVLVTRNYSMFKKLTDNRQIDEHHVKRLCISFREEHLITPIIVNEKYEVIDGQNRLAAAIETAMPVYYIVINGYGINQVSRLNSNMKNWTKKDYLNMYVVDDRKPYVEFKKFMDSFPAFGIQSCERILTFKGGNTASFRNEKNGKKSTNLRMKDFEEGKLVLPNVELSYKYARMISDFEPYYKDYTRGTFVSCMIPLLKNSKVYNHKEMIYKLTVAPIRLTNCTTVSAYRLLLEDIYNWKRPKDSKVSFRHI